MYMHKIILILFLLTSVAYAQTKLIKGKTYTATEDGVFLTMSEFDKMLVKLRAGKAHRLYTQQADSVISLMEKRINILEGSIGEISRLDSMENVEYEALITLLERKAELVKPKWYEHRYIVSLQTAGMIWLASVLVKNVK